MPDSTDILASLSVILFPVMAALFAYAGYWGLAIGRGLVMRAYRNQAFVASATSFYVIVILLMANLVPVTPQSGTAVLVASGLIDYGLFALIIYWVNATFSIAKRSDPLERDTLHYSVTKYVWFLANTIPVATALLANPLILVYSAPAPLDPLSLSLGLAPLFITGTFGAALMFLSATRSNDKTLRWHIRWFARALAVTIAIFASSAVWRDTGGNSSPYILILDPIYFGGQALVAYCFYKSAKSLAPTTKTL